VEEHVWGKLGERPYTDDEYRYANDDPVPQNGAYRGVSWWTKDFDAPASFAKRRTLLHIRGARLRAEVFLNEKLVGYSIMAELPIVCDLTEALRPGARNRLTIRITNPGGRYDWRDSTTMTWGAVKLFRSHGFGGIDRDVHLTSHPLDAHVADAWVLNLRGFKADPALVRASLLPVRPVAKQRRLAYAAGESAVLDLFLFNDTGKAVSGELALSLRDPQGAVMELGRYPVAATAPDRFSQLVAREITTPALAREGEWQVHLSFSGAPGANFTRSLWVAGLPAQVASGRRIAVSGIARSLRAQLEALPGLRLEEFRPEQRYDLVIASGLKADEIARRQIGEQTGLEAQPKKGEKPKLVLGELSAQLLAAVRSGTPLLALVPEDGLSEGVARQLADLGLLEFKGTVGDIRAPWMGNWNYLRAHPLFAGIPADRAAGIFHQVDGRLSNGLLVDGPGVEIVAGYSRDHDRHNGAATLVAASKGMRAVVHRMPDMVAPLQRRFLANAIEWLAGQGRTS